MHVKPFSPSRFQNHSAARNSWRMHECRNTGRVFDTLDSLFGHLDCVPVLIIGLSPSSSMGKEAYNVRDYVLHCRFPLIDRLSAPSQHRANTSAREAVFGFGCLLWQVPLVPFPENPLLHWQENDPLLFVHTPCVSQLWLPSIHSFMSGVERR